MPQIPPRPTADKAMVLSVAKIIAAKLDGADAETIAQHYSRHMDGFDLCIKLSKYAGWVVTRDDMDILDELDYLVDQAERDAVREWVGKFDPQPMLPIGTRIKEGVITGLSDGYYPACYLVKVDGETNDNSRRIIKFEAAVPT
ncbi:hypothetical protein [Pseudomonas bohemica]|uniref:hypothetical protein n=1 Tax=Pseudomonas bohemica TaxID=2044872 RepID=UPI000DA60671|nr:hypothetical protein [Pseudomonas bohemica]